MIRQHNTLSDFITTYKYGHVYSLASTTTSTGQQKIGHCNCSEHLGQICHYFTSLK